MSPEMADDTWPLAWGGCPACTHFRDVILAEVGLGVISLHRAGIHSQ